MLGAIDIIFRPSLAVVPYFLDLLRSSIFYDCILSAESCYASHRAPTALTNAPQRSDLLPRFFVHRFFFVRPFFFLLRRQPQ
jgi:hypothetical protein